MTGERALANNTPIKCELGGGGANLCTSVSAASPINKPEEGFGLRHVPTFKSEEITIVPMWIAGNT